MNCRHFLLISLALLGFTGAAFGQGAIGGAAGKLTSGSPDVTAAQVNGTWKYRKNVFKIWALGGGKLQVSFDGVFEYDTPKGPSANMGTGFGVALIQGDTAVFKPEGVDGNDKIILRFTGGKLIAKQEGTCGFGHRVAADGTYQKVSSKKPNFEE